MSEWKDYKSYEEIRDQECNAEFYRKMEHSKVMSFYKYGAVAENYSNGLGKATESIERCLQKYYEDGNTDHLVDIGNYAEIEYTYPQHPKAHYSPKEGWKSFQGLSVGEMME